MRVPFVLAPLVSLAFLAACESAATSSGADVSVEGHDVPTDSSSDLGDSAAPAVDVSPEGPAEDVGAQDLTEALFPADRAIQVEITIDPDDWDTLRAQTRDIFDILGEGCMEAPFESPFTYFPGTVTVDGETLDNVGVRKKGFLGSLSVEKPSLKIKAHEYVEGATFSGQKRLTLNNVQQDPAYISTCLTYHLYRSAGMVAPRCGFAEVTVNGDLLGAYVSIDSIKKPFLQREFGDDSGTLYEGTLSDFRDGWTQTFDQKTLKTQGPGGHVAAVTAALEASDDELLDQLDQVIDLDQFMSFWALEVFVGHWDGYAGNTNNFYIYAHPGDQRLRFIPWGADATFVPNMDLQDDQKEIPASVMAQGVLARRLYLHPEGRSWYTARMQWVLDSVFAEEAIHQEVDRLESILTPMLFSHQVGPAFDRMNQVRSFINGRRAQIQIELDGGGADWPYPLRDSFCFEFEAGVAATVDSNFGTIQNPNPYTNPGGELVFDPQQEKWDFQATGIQVGFSDDPDQAGRATIRIFKQLESGESIVAIWIFDPEDIAPGAVIPIDFEKTEGHLIHLGGPEGFIYLGPLFSGAIHIEAGTTTFGTPFKATIDSLWFLP